MRLLVDTHCFDYKTTEGINTHLKGLYGALVKIAADIDFYFVAHDIAKVKSIFGEAANIHYVALTSQHKIYRLLFEFPAIIKKYGIDAAHFQYTSPLVKNCKTIVTLHDILFADFPQHFPLSYRLLKGILFRLSAKRADLLLTVSEYSKRQIFLHYKIPIGRIHVTPNAVSEDFSHIDTASTKEYLKKQGIDRYVLYVSRIEPRKNQIALLRAWYELHLWQQDYDLVFIGRRTLPSVEFDIYYESLSDAIKAHVHIINQVCYEELKYWYRGASLFVYPALAEGFGIPPIEAGVAGVPCICSSKTAMGDFTFFGDNLISPRDNQSLKEAIVRNLKDVDSENLKRISQAIVEKYNWFSIASDFYRILKEDLLT